MPVPRDFDGILAGQEILCWLQPNELALVALGAGAEDAQALATRVRDWLAERQPLEKFHVATAAYSAEGGTIDALLEAVGRGLAQSDATAAQAVA
jgi:hypothetical protein